MTSSVRFPYIERDAAVGNLSRMPFLPLELAANGLIIPALAMLDTGSSLNVLPYALGRAFGFVWEQQTTRIQLSGSLGEAESRAVALRVTIAPFASVLLAFAWTQAENAPLLLGQMNFFQEFDVCFFERKASSRLLPACRPDAHRAKAHRIAPPQIDLRRRRLICGGAFCRLPVS